MFYIGETGGNSMRKKQIAALGMAAALIATSISPVNVMKVSAASKNLKITKSMVKKGKFVVPKGTYQNITIDKNVDGASVVLKNVNVKKTIVVNGKGKKAITLNVKANTKVNKVTVNAKKSAVVVGSKGSVKNLVSNAADMKLSGEGKVSNVKLNAKNQSVKLGAGKVTTTDKATASINYVDVKGKSEVKLGDFTEVTKVVDGKDQKISYDKDGQEVTSALSYDGYTEKWRDDFNGNKLDRNNWNVELHEPGWVNNELQEYVDSDKNIIVKDGKLILKAIKTTDKDGKVSYTLIKNGSFNADFTGFETFVDESAAAVFSIDELNNGGKKTPTIEIEDTADKEWKIQLKQTGVKLENGKCYKLSFKAKSTLDRTIQYALQRDGSVHKNADGGEDWTPYTQETVSVTGDYQTFEKKFKMTFDSDDGTIFNISMGGNNIKDKHTISIDDIVLVEIPESEMPKEPTIEAGENLLKNANFANSFGSWNAPFFYKNGTTTFGSAIVQNNSVVYTIENVGTDNWHIQLKQSGIKLHHFTTFNSGIPLNEVHILGALL